MNVPTIAPKTLMSAYLLLKKYFPLLITWKRSQKLENLAIDRIIKAFSIGMWGINSTSDARKVYNSKKIKQYDTVIRDNLERIYTKEGYLKLDYKLCSYPEWDVYKRLINIDKLKG